MFRKSKKMEAFDSEKQIAVLRVSICTGEKSLLFRSRNTGTEEQVCAVSSDKEWKRLCREYHIPPDQVRQEY